MKKKKSNPLAWVYFESNIIDVLSNTWWLDTNAIILLTNCLQVLINLRKPNDGELVVWLGERIIFVPYMRRNLIFVVSLNEKGYSCYFRNSNFNLFYDYVIISSGFLCNILYKKLSPSLLFTLKCWTLMKFCKTF